MLESGYRISDLDNIPVTDVNSKFKDKIALDNTFLLSYSHTVYGINYNKHNYKIPLSSLRDDIKGYIGVESLVAPWSDQLKLWHGSWYDSTSRNRSYTHVWTADEFTHEHYSPEKFNDLENSYFIIKKAPFPFESGEVNNRERGEKEATVTSGVNTVISSINIPIAPSDPHPESTKLVTKEYVDERLASKRIIEVGTDFWIRDYDCSYIIRQADILAEEVNGAPIIIKIHYPESFNKRAHHNQLKFSVLIEGKWDTTKECWVPAVSQDAEWMIFDNNGNPINLVWMHDGENKVPELTDEYLYDNARYMVLNFETVTDGIDTIKKPDNTYETKARIVTFGTCENFLYRNTGIERVNGIESTFLELVSSNNAIDISTSLVGSTLTVDFHGYARPSIKEVNGPIQLNECFKTLYWSRANNLQLTFENSGIGANESTTCNLLYHPSSTSQIQGNIQWAMTPDKVSPVFKNDRIYNISFIYVPEISGLMESQIIGRVNWFKFV